MELSLPLPPSPQLVVRSPRQTSLLRNRRPQHERRYEREHEPPSSSASGPKPREVYGFVGSITTVIATTVYLVWAYTPEPCLRSLGITYYPAKYWALAVPSLVMVAVVLSMLIYIAFNFLATPPPTSLSIIHDEYSHDSPPPATTPQEAIQPISDIPIHQINNLMFAHSPSIPHPT